MSDQAAPKKLSDLEKLIELMEDSPYHPDRWIELAKRSLEATEALHAAQQKALADDENSTVGKGVGRTNHPLAGSGDIAGHGLVEGESLEKKRLAELRAKIEKEMKETKKVKDEWIEKSIKEDSKSKSQEYHGMFNFYDGVWNGYRLSLNLIADVQAEILKAEAKLEASVRMESK
jgi:hypothetical protein